MNGTGHEVACVGSNCSTTSMLHHDGNGNLNFHLREIKSFFEACLAAAAATLTFLRSLVRHLARFAHVRRRFWPRGRCPVAVARTVQKLEDSSGRN